MTQGYIFLGVDDHNKTTNIECAYALSLSLKLHDPDRETCVVVHRFSDVPQRYEDGFDYIIELPFGRTEINHHNIMIDFWQLYHCTPFDHSMFINTYSVATTDITSYWDAAEIDTITFATSKTFRNEVPNENFYATQIENKIRHFDANVMFFKKDDLTTEFFKMADPVFKNWREMYRTLEHQRPTDFDLTVMVNIVAKLLGETYILPETFNYIDIRHNVTDNETATIESLQFWFTDTMDFKINNHRQSGLVYYHDPEVMNFSDILNKIHGYYQKETTTLAS